MNCSSITAKSMAITIASNLRQKSNAQVLLFDDNACGYRMKCANTITDEEYCSRDFIGVYKPSTDRFVIEQAIKSNRVWGSS